MKPEIGDKYIIEIDRAYASKKHAESRFGIKGFENFVLSKRNISDALKYGNIELLTDHDTREGVKEYQRGYDAGEEHAWMSFAGWTPRTLEEQKSEAYQRGLDDAWEAAWTILADWSDEEFCRFFKTDSLEDVRVGDGARKVVEMLRKHEQKKAVKTNWEKFKEVFGHPPTGNGVVSGINMYDSGWWDLEYREPESEGEDDRS